MNPKKTTIRFLTYLSIFLLFAGGVGFLIQHLLNDKIRELFVREINKQLTTEVQVDQVKLSVFRDFPYASVRFNGVRLNEAVNRPNKGVLMKAGVISLRFGLLDLLRSKFTVSNVFIKDARFNMRAYADGSDNYHFWKSSSSSSSGGKDFTVDLQRIDIRNSRITYRDELSGHDLRVILHEAAMKGRFSNKNYLLETTGDMLIEQLTTSNTTYIHDRPAKLNLSLNVNNREGLYTLKKGILGLNDLQLSTTGWLIIRSDRRDMDFSVAASEATLAELISTIPAKYRKKLDGYRFEGRGKVSVSIKGKFNGNHVPAIKASLILNDGIIGRQKSSVAIKNVSLAANYSILQDMQNEVLTITGIQAKLKNGSISGSFSTIGLSSSQIQAAVKADIDLEDVRNFLNLDTITALKGRLIFNGRFDGQLANISHPSVDDFNRSRLIGNAQISQGEFGLKGYNLPASGINGNFSFDNNNLGVRKLAFKYGRSDFEVKTTINNLMAWLMVKNEKLVLRSSDITSSLTDWDEISESSSGSGQYNFTLPADIEVKELRMNVKNFTFRKFTAASISTNLQLHNRILSAGNILMQSMQGVVSGQATINSSNPGHSFIQCKANLSRVNLKSLFAEFGNFGSTDLTAENLEGLITADVIFAAMMYPNLDIDAQSVKMHAEIRVENGRLVKYAPMQSLSKFLRVEDLADIRFATMQNQVDIANQIIYIPGMEIKSSALDLSLMGTHTFSNDIEYHFSIALADLLAAKFHRKNPGFNKQSEFGPVEDDHRGRSMVYVSMTGTANNPVFGYDKRAIRDKISTELSNQKVELKEALRREFGSGQGDTLKKAQNAKEKEIRKKQEEGKFVIEWDDDRK